MNSVRTVLIMFSVCLGILLGIALAEANIPGYGIPQNTAFDNLKLYFGLDKNEYTFTDDDIRIGGYIGYTSKYDTDRIEWYFDGDKLKTDRFVRKSGLIVGKTSPKKDLVQYKAGKDPKTKLERHILQVKYDGGVRTWHLTE